jgi:hypothetical protein
MAAKAEWAEAFVRAQSQLINPPKTETAKIKTKTGADFQYTYAALPDIIDSIRIVLHENGLAFAQSVVSNDGMVGVSTIIYHRGGHAEHFGPLYMPAGQTPQEYGSATTYARRYALCAALGIAADSDDDAQAASKTKTSRGARVDEPSRMGKAKPSESIAPRKTTPPPRLATGGSEPEEQPGGGDTEVPIPSASDSGVPGDAGAAVSPEQTSPGRRYPNTVGKCEHRAFDMDDRCLGCGAPASRIEKASA